MIFPFTTILLVIQLISRTASNALFSRNGALSGAIDLTLEPGRTGDDVVSSCLKKLDYLNVFSNDLGITKRIAKAESDFGANYTRIDSSRGIWQVSSVAIAEIQSQLSHPSIALPLEKIRAFYGEAVIDFTNLDHTIPFHSAVAARIFVELLQNSYVIPGGVSEQATWWSDYFKPGSDKTRFVNSVNLYEAIKTCPSKPLDLFFLLDASSSVGATHFQIALHFVNEISRKFLISPSMLRTGLSTYSWQNSVNRISKLNQHMDNTAFETAVNNTVYSRGRTYTGSAIYDVISHGFSEVAGVRTYSLGVPRVLVLLTDGYSSDSVSGPTTQATSAGITTYAIGVGLGVVTDEINEIASFPHTLHSYTVPEYTDLASTLAERLSLQLCDASAGMPITGLTSLSIASSSQRFAHVRIPATGSVTLELSASGSGSGHLYISNMPNPSSSFFLSSLQITQGLRITFTITADSSPIKTRSSTTVALHVTGYENDADEVPIYFTATSTGGGDLTLDLKTIYVAPVISSTTTESTTTATAAPSSQKAPPELWVILGIVVAGFILLLIIISAILITIGLRRSSKLPKLSDNVIASSCACLLKSTSY